MKTFKYSTIVTLLLTVLSALAIFGIDDVIPNVLNDPLKTHILNNLDNYNAFLFGIFTGSLVSLIVAVVGYTTERRKTIAEIWNDARKLTIDFKLLLLDNIDFENLSHDNLLDTIKTVDFNQEVREWLGYHSSPYTINTMELDFIFNWGKTANLLNGLQKNIAVLRTTVDGFMNAYLNDKLEDPYGDVDMQNLIAVITNQDEEKALKTVEAHLEEIIKLLRKK